MKAPIRLEDATPRDVELCYGEAYAFEYAVVMVRGDHLLAICGYFEHQGEGVLFADLAGDAFQYPVSIIKGVKRVIAHCHVAGKTIVTLPDNRDAARRTLKHLGFKKRGDGWESLPPC